MAVLAIVLAVVLLPVTVWVTFRGVRYAMKPRGTQGSLASDRILVRRDLVGIAVSGLAFAYWHGIDLDAVALLERAANAVIVTALAALIATVVSTVLLVAVSRGRRRETLRRCGLVFGALAPFVFFLVTFVLIGDSAIEGGDSPGVLLVSILAATCWLTLMPTTLYYAFRYSFRIGEAPEALLPMVVFGTAVVCLLRSTIRVADRGFLDGFPVWVGVLFAFGGPLTVLVIVGVYDLMPMLSRREGRTPPTSTPGARTARHRG